MYPYTCTCTRGRLSKDPLIFICQEPGGVSRKFNKKNSCSPGGGGGGGFACFFKKQGNDEA
jgi:hypothetical protein